MSIIHFRLRTLPLNARLGLLFFLLALSFGYITGAVFLGAAGQTSPVGIEEGYLGNEEDADAMEFEFKKPFKEVLTIVHTHALSLSVIFLLLSVLVIFSQAHKKLKAFLIMEPFISIILTFGGLWLMWSGHLWMVYVVMISGGLMHLCFLLMMLVIIRELFRK